jgi:hypothetical protein
VEGTYSVDLGELLDELCFSEGLVDVDWLLIFLGAFHCRNDDRDVQIPSIRIVSRRF